MLIWAQPVPVVTRTELQSWDPWHLPRAPCGLLTHIRAGQSPESGLPCVFSTALGLALPKTPVGYVWPGPTGSGWCFPLRGASSFALKP